MIWTDWVKHYVTLEVEGIKRGCPKKTVQALKDTCCGGTAPTQRSSANLHCGDTYSSQAPSVPAKTSHHFWYRCQSIFAEYVSLIIPK